MSIWFILYLVISVISILRSIYLVDQYKSDRSLFIFNALCHLVVLCIFTATGKFDTAEANWIVVMLGANMGCWFGMGF